MRPRISIKGSARPSVRHSVRRFVDRSVGTAFFLKTELQKEGRALRALHYYHHTTIPTEFFSEKKF